MIRYLPARSSSIRLNWFRTSYLSVLLLDGFVLAIKYVDRPLVVVLQRRSHHQLPEPVPVHVGYLDQRRTQPRVLSAVSNLQRPLQNERSLEEEF